MHRTETSEVGEVDLSTCDREPIHTPGSVQPHGLLIALDGDDLTVRRASRNASEAFGRDLDEILGQPLAALIGAGQFEGIKAGLVTPSAERNASFVGDVRVGRNGTTTVYHALSHRIGDEVVLELEPSPQAGPVSAADFHAPLVPFLSRLDGVRGPEALAHLAASEIRRITGFDRVLVYRFDEDGHGTVVAEEGNGRLPSYLGHRFPASDIPRQARELYRLNRLRLIPDASYTPVPVVPDLAEPLDLSYSVLRSVSPVHVEYMRNMGTAASMSISVVRDDRLWGLISCHHKAPRLVPFGLRLACDLLAQVFAIQLANQEHQAEYQQRLRLGSVQARLVASLTAKGDFVSGLADHADDLLAFAEAGGVAIAFDGRFTLLGETPPEGDVRRITDWLSSDVRREVFATDSLPGVLPWAGSIRDRAAGLLAVSISKLHKNYLLWFRPEIVRTVTWAGDPRKPADPPAGRAPARLSPRTSFEAWKEVVRHRSAPWRRSETEGAVELRNAIVGVVLRRAEELAQLNAELRRSNEELEAFSYSVSHDLRAPLRHIVGYSELLREMDGDRVGPSGRRYIDTIIESVQYAGLLVDNLLSFSRMGQTTVQPVVVDMNLLVREAVAEAARDAGGRSIAWKVGDLPPARGDLMMLRLAVTNLLSNAVKYTRPVPEAVVEVGGEARDGETVYWVRDNGVGFDMKYVDKLFGVFQRLHRMEEFEGTGIGLANVRRITARHGGRAWAEGAVGAGATFFIALPRADSVRGGHAC